MSSIDGSFSICVYIRDFSFVAIRLQQFAIVKRPRNIDLITPNFTLFFFLFFFFFFFAKNIQLGYTLRGGSNVYLQLMFWSERRKISLFSIRQLLSFHSRYNRILSYRQSSEIHENIDDI